MNKVLWGDFKIKNCSVRSVLMLFYWMKKGTNMLKNMSICHRHKKFMLAYHQINFINDT